MKKKSLLETNVYLKDPVKCEAALIRAVVYSSAIEGVHCKGIERHAASARTFIVKKTSPARRLSKPRKAA